MTLIDFSFVILAFGYVAGVVGALTGLGGGVVLVPTLVLLFGIDIHYAMGASLISVVATSSGGAIAYLKDGYTNLRVGMLLEIGAVVGVLIGAVLLTQLSPNNIAIIFGCVLVYSAYTVGRYKETAGLLLPKDKWATFFHLNGSYPTRDGDKPYHPQQVPLAMSIMTLAGMASGMLGIGAGTLKVLAMDKAMHLPYRVSTTTSNFLIGITAAVTAGVYFFEGYIQPALAFPVMLGVLAGAISGARLMAIIPVRALRLIFGVVVFVLATQMIYKGIYGQL